jgi:FkbM family methyltransferase
MTGKEQEGILGKSMNDQLLLLLRRFSVTLKRIPGFIFLLEPMRKLFASRKQPVVVSDFDGHLKVKLRLDEHMQSQIFWYGYYSRDIVLLMNRILQPRMVVLDVGANIGEITMAAAQRVGSNGHVYSFEPMTPLYSRLTEHLGMNGMNQVTPIAKGLSDRIGTATIFSAEAPFEDGTRHDGLGTLYPTASRSVAAGDIELTTLDEFCSSSNITRIDLVKIDVEGAELAVLKGGLTSIARFQPFLIVEVQTETAQDAGYKSEDIISLLKSMGYTFFVIGRKARLRPLGEAGLASFQNVLCVPAGVEVP